MNLIKYFVCVFTLLYAAGTWRLDHDYVFGALVLITAIYMLIRPYDAWRKGHLDNHTLGNNDKKEADRTRNE